MKVALVSLCLGACTAEEAPQLKVAAAADLAFAFPEIGAMLERESGVKVRFSFVSSGQLAKQIAEGAPYDVFAAANVSFVDDVLAAGRCAAHSKTIYARGQLVVWSAQPLDAFAALAEPRFRKLAIANPEHAPYGTAAKQALERAGLWGAVQSRVVYGENVKQALQFVESGNAEAALIASSLALASAGGQVLPVDPALHEPLDQALVVCSGGAPARRFVELLGSPAGRTIMRRHGFLLPGEATAQAK